MKHQNQTIFQKSVPAVGAVVKGSSPRCEFGPGGAVEAGGQESCGTDQVGTEPWPCLEEELPLGGALFDADLGQLVQSVW